MKGFKVISASPKILKENKRIIFSTFPQTSRLILIWTILLPINFLFGQSRQNSFIDAFNKSRQYINPEIAVHCTDNSFDGLSKLIAKSNWKVEELDTLNCLFSNFDFENQELAGILFYIGGHAYVNYDDKIRDSLFQKAYFSFKKSNDKQGIFFSLTSILGYAQYQAETDFKKYDIDALFHELSQLKKEINSPITNLIFGDLFLRNNILNERVLEIEQLDSIGNYGKIFTKLFPSFVAQLYTVIGITYRIKGNYSKALEYYKKAILLIDHSTSDYFSYVTNVGTGYYLLEHYDSAHFYWKMAYNYIENPKSIYNLENKSAIANKLVKLFEKINQPDSAKHYKIIELEFENEKLALERDESNLYQTKKFELTQKQQTIAMLDLALAKKQNRIIIISTISFLLVVFLIMTTILLYNQKELSKQKAVIATEREILLRTIGHDLVTPLQMFATSAILVPKLIEEKRWQDLKDVGDSLNNTIVALRSMLNNLVIWNNKLKNSIEEEKKEPIAVAAFVEDIKTIYLSYAQSKNITINIEATPTQIIQSNPIHLGTLLRNLLFNSLKHGVQNSQIEILVKPIGNEVKFEIKNVVPNVGIFNAYTFAKAINNLAITGENKDGLGLELILYSIKTLEIKARATLNEDILTVTLVFY